ncbi:hypothetical protein BXZ70DRAFT_1006204 [Cristinia sonorae]|uniref:DUF6533 domain-containing protein n=1 Tax=Cristinia sonorae TaxID=1940300 RepID=A0A8K0USH8_9AGAR|nr:hypothetical protein BXZ70DRAFT_1006204 [Cristinia sonorae]
MFTALVFYDYLITINDERRLLWRKDVKFNGGIVIFVINRYLTIATVIASATAMVPMHTHQEFSLSYTFLSSFQLREDTDELSCPGFLDPGLPCRTYAVWHGNIVVGILVFLLHCAPLICRALFISLPSFPKATRIYSKGVLKGGCFWSTPSKPMNPDLRKYSNALHALYGSHHCYPEVTKVYCITMIGAYAMTCILTWIKTYKLAKQAREVNMSVSLSGMLLRDGSILFVVVTAMSLVETLWLVLSKGDVTYFLVVALISVLVSHFIFNLQQASEHHAGQSAISTVGSAVFAPRSNYTSHLVGDLGNTVTLGALDSGSWVSTDVYSDSGDEKRDISEEDEETAKPVATQPQAADAGEMGQLCLGATTGGSSGINK